MSERNKVKGFFNYNESQITDTAVNLFIQL